MVAAGAGTSRRQQRCSRLLLAEKRSSVRNTVAGRRAAARQAHDGVVTRGKRLNDLTSEDGGFRQLRRARAGTVGTSVRTARLRTRRHARVAQAVGVFMVRARRLAVPPQTANPGGARGGLAANRRAPRVSDFPIS
jgi:hypothetical protein